MDRDALLTSIKNRDPAAAKALLRNQPELSAARLDNGLSLLLVAIYYGQQEIVQAIRSGRTELDIWEATALGELPSVKALIGEEESLVDAVAADGFSPLGLAAFFGHLEVLRWLVDNGADVDQPAQNEMRVRPIHSVAAHRKAAVALSMMQALLEAGAQVNVAQHGGWTPLHQAADHGHQPLVMLLLQHGADPTARSDNGQTPADMARAKGFDDVVAFLESP